MGRVYFFFFSSRRRHTRLQGDWSSACALPISRPAPALGWLELLAIDNGGVEVPLAQPLDERAVRLGLNDPIELGAVGGDEAHTVDQHVVHLPAAVPQVHAIVEQDLGPPLGEHL